MQNIVVKMKDELEQIKEQVLNALWYPERNYPEVFLCFLWKEIIRNYPEIIDGFIWKEITRNYPEILILARWRRQNI
jgi:hypothetical protein